MRCLLSLVLLLTFARPVNAQSITAPWPAPNNFFTSASISTATTTLIISGTANTTTWLWYAGLYGASIALTATVALISGTGATCTGSPTTWASFPLTQTSLSMNTLFGEALNSTVGPQMPPTPLPIPSGATPVNVCIVTSGTVSGSAVGFAVWAVN